MVGTKKRHLQSPSSSLIMSDEEIDQSHYQYSVDENEDVESVVINGGRERSFQKSDYDGRKSLEGCLPGQGNTILKIEDIKWEIIQGVENNGNSLFATLAHLCGKNMVSGHRFMRAKTINVATTKDYWEGIKKRVEFQHFRHLHLQERTDDKLKEAYRAKMLQDKQPASWIELGIASQIFPFAISCISRGDDKESVVSVFNFPTPSMELKTGGEEGGGLLQGGERKWILCTERFGQNDYFQPLDVVGNTKPLLLDQEYTITDNSHSQKKEKVQKKSSTIEKERKNAVLECDGEDDDMNKSLPATTTKKKIVKCAEEGCERKFDSAASYKNHLYKDHDHPPVLENEETGVEYYPCPFPGCKTEAVNKDALYAHFAEYHYRIGRFKCKKCQKQFMSKQKLNRHVNCVHCNIRRFSCDLCKKSYKDRSHLTRHKRNVHLIS